MSALTEILNSISVEGTLCPSTIGQIQAFEKQANVPLPASYRQFCQTLGPGSLGGWYEFASPGYSGFKPHRWDLASRNIDIRAGREWEEYAEDADQFRRALIFAGDQATGTYFFDPAIVTVPKLNEYAVFAIWRDWSTERVAETFLEFVEVCLHRGDRKLYDEAPKLMFSAPWQGGQSRAKGKLR